MGGSLGDLTIDRVSAGRSEMAVKGGEASMVTRGNKGGTRVMQNRMSLLKLAQLALLGMLFASSQVLGQDPVKVASKNVKVVYENHRLRVIEVRIKPGEKLPMHSHPAHLILTLSDFKGKYLRTTGEARIFEGKPSAWTWTEPITHSSENVGTTEIHAFAIELKDPPRRSVKSPEAVDSNKK